MMTSLTTLAADASAAPAWLHVLVMAAAVLILLYSLSRHSS
ncbi:MULTISPECIES: hypothetical protein [unclassified Streptomyces]|nr:hypothetical protein [Streptomyces sp. JV176]MEE1799627.1 hypothetical protein [Streptomyces sp. JV176]